MEMVYYKNLFERSEVYPAVKSTHSSQLTVLELDNGAIGIIPEFVMKRIPDGVFDKTIEVQITGISSLYKALVLRPTFTNDNPLLKNLVAHEGTIDLITPHGLGIDCNGEKLAFACYQEFYTKMKRKDKVKFFMYADDDCAPQIWCLKEACINGVWVDFSDLSRAGIKENDPVFAPVVFLKRCSDGRYYSSNLDCYFFNIPCEDDFCIYDRGEDKILISWNKGVE